MACLCSYWPCYRPSVSQYSRPQANATDVQYSHSKANTTKVQYSNPQANTTNLGPVNVTQRLYIDQILCN